ncbi:hypothetical protein HPB51_019523 [Rhipicephalus microplus]|uniref:Uncharacterized protein n=1 Tax=Rhipicephalus microplus TaxID=6941 RepID=A0A9J6DWR6_RHIMP|nr:hypothetical protein HPB51_019523 [Rhipicephalus microplus]
MFLSSRLLLRRADKTSGRDDGLSYYRFWFGGFVRDSQGNVTSVYTFRSVRSTYLWFKALRRIQDSWSTQPPGGPCHGVQPLGTVSLSVSNRDGRFAPMSIVGCNGSSSVQPADQELLQFPDGQTAKLWRTGNPNANSVIISVSPARSESNGSFYDSTSTAVAVATPAGFRSVAGSFDDGADNNNIADGTRRASVRRRATRLRRGQKWPCLMVRAEACNSTSRRASGSVASPFLD